MTSVIEQTGVRPASGDRAPLSSVVAEITNNPTTAASGRTVRRVGRPVLIQVLGDLQTEGITAPAAVRRALELDTETARALTPAPSVADWLGTQDLDAVTGEQIVTAMEGHAVRQLVGTQTDRYAQEVLAHLLQRAVDVLAGDLDRIIAELRPKWSDAAADVAAAAAAGITSSTTADDVLGAGSDEVIAAWRKIGPAVAVLDRIQTLTNRLLFLCGHYLGEDETNRRGRAAWLDASGSGPVPLRSLGERSEVDTRTGVKVGVNRHPVAIGMHTEMVETAERAEEVTTEQRTAFARADHEAQLRRRQAEADATTTTIDQPTSEPLGGF